MKDVNLLINRGVNIEKSLELLGDIETYNEILIDFLNAINEKMAKIKLYKESHNMNDYAILVHSLKSDSRYLGFDKLANIAYQHELESKANNINFVVNNYDDLESEAKKVVSLVNEYLGKSPSQGVSVPERSAPIMEKSLLIVDDSNLMQNYIEKIFRDKYPIILAKDGREAIDIVSNNTNMILGMLLDLNMPKVNGFEVLDYFKQNNLFDIIPVSIITGADSREMINKAFSYPIIDMLTKPFNESSVHMIVEKTISNR